MKQGDLVRLNSGGPGLTIESVTEAECVCVWFHNKKLKRATFHPSQLTRMTRKVSDALQQHHDDQGDRAAEKAAHQHTSPIPFI